MTQADIVYKTRDEVVAEVLAAWAARIPDINLTPDTIARIWTEVFGTTVEGLFLGMQLLHDDMFIQSMSALALSRSGSQYGRSQKLGTLATGTVRLTGAGGAFVAMDSEVGSPRPALGDTLRFHTTDDATIPNPGTPAAPTAADHAVAGNVNGTMEYAVTFTTVEGETEIGEASNTLVLVNSQTDLTNIPLGGDGTVSRKIYRRKNGGLWAFVHTLADNVTTIYTDNITDGVLGGVPPDDSTAERVTVAAAATATGADYNAAPGAITEIVSIDADVSAVTNVAAFTGGSDDEAIEEFRQKLLEWVRAPQSGSALDLVAWATSIEGVDTATVYKNVDLDGDPALGTVTVLIAGPNGTVPDVDKVAEVLAYLESKDLANITILVGTFDPLTIEPDVSVELTDGYVLADVNDSVKAAIIDYVDSVPVGGTVYVAGIYHAVFSLPGIATVVVNLPAADVVAGDTEKPVATVDDVTVDEV